MPRKIKDRKKVIKESNERSRERIKAYLTGYEIPFAKNLNTKQLRRKLDESFKTSRYPVPC